MGALPARQRLQASGGGGVVDQVPGTLAAGGAEAQASVAVDVQRAEDLRVAVYLDHDPGGFLFVNSGLVLKAGTEAELAGAMAHEIAHVAARQGKSAAEV